MEDILRDIKGVIVYQDDILLHASSTDMLAKRVSNVLKRLEEKNVTVNAEKSVMFAEKVQFLGHLISSDGIQPDPPNAAKILSCKPPRNRAELESFLGLVNFFGRMLPNFAQMTAPLHHLRLKNVPFASSNQHQVTFDK